MGMATGNAKSFDYHEGSVIAYRTHCEMLEKEIKLKHHFENVANRQAGEIKQLEAENERLRGLVRTSGLWGLL